jgi:RNA polymerase sigma factor (sigma-70 family)
MADGDRGKNQNLKAVEKRFLSLCEELYAQMREIEPHIKFQPEIREEALQNTAVRVIGSPEKLSKLEKLSGSERRAYLSRAITNNAKQVYRKQRFGHAAVEEMSDEDRHNPAGILESAETYEAVEATLSSLTALEKDVYVLTYDKEWPVRKIAECLGKSETAIRQVRFRLKTKLLRVLQD